MKIGKGILQEFYYLKNGNRGQIASAIIIVTVVMLCLLIATVNIGRTAVYKTQAENCADSAALAGISTASSVINLIAWSLLGHYKEWRGALGSMAGMVVANAAIMAFGTGITPTTQLSSFTAIAGEPAVAAPTTSGIGQTTWFGQTMLTPDAAIANKPAFTSGPSATGEGLVSQGQPAPAESPASGSGWISNIIALLIVIIVIICCTMIRQGDIAHNLRDELKEELTPNILETTIGTAFLNAKVSEMNPKKKSETIDEWKRRKTPFSEFMENGDEDGGYSENSGYYFFDDDNEVKGSAWNVYKWKDTKEKEHFVTVLVYFRGKDFKVPSSGHHTYPKAVVRVAVIRGEPAPEFELLNFNYGDKEQTYAWENRFFKERIWQKGSDEDHGKGDFHRLDHHYPKEKYLRGVWSAAQGWSGEGAKWAQDPFGWSEPKADAAAWLEPLWMHSTW